MKIIKKGIIPIFPQFIEKGFENTDYKKT